MFNCQNGLGASKQLQESLNQRRKAEERAAEQRRLFEAEQQQKAAAASGARLEGAVFSFGPWIAGGLGLLLLVGLLKRKKGGAA